MCKEGANDDSQRKRMSRSEEVDFCGIGKARDTYESLMRRPVHEINVRSQFTSLDQSLKFATASGFS